MKASTAANILRAARARFEMWGIIQFGPQEFVAMQFAHTKTNNETLKMMIHNGIMGFQRLNQEMYEGLREAYKALEKSNPNEEFSLKDITLGVEQVNGTEAEPKAADMPEWMKKLEKDLQNFKPDDFKEGENPESEGPKQ